MFFENLKSFFGFKDNNTNVNDNSLDDLHMDMDQSYIDSIDTRHIASGSMLEKM